MRCCSVSSCGSSKDRCLFTSVLMLGALLGLMSSPAARVPLVSTFVILGVPLLTFAVAAPSRLGLFRELALVVRGAEAALLTTLLGALRLLGARTGRAMAAVTLRQRRRVEAAYAGSHERMAALVGEDPLRLHHARRLATLGAVLATLAGVGLPFVHGDVYTFGDFPQAPFVFALDVLVFGLVSRVVGERVMIRLYEASAALGAAGDPNDAGTWSARARAMPLTTMLGGALGAVSALVVVSAGAAACAVETAWISDVGFAEPAFWFIRATAPMGLPLGIAIGAILGAGAGLAQPPKRARIEA